MIVTFYSCAVVFTLGSVCFRVFPGVSWSQQEVLMGWALLGHNRFTALSVWVVGFENQMFLWRFEVGHRSQGREFPNKTETRGERHGGWHVLSRLRASQSCRPLVGRIKGGVQLQRLGSVMLILQEENLWRESEQRDDDRGQTGSLFNVDQRRRRSRWGADDGGATTKSELHKRIGRWTDTDMLL